MQKMIATDYGEMKAFEGKESRVGYWCRSCPAMAEEPKSLTGYWCQKNGYPDRPHGCCRNWYPFPDVQKRQRT